jgi:hypothetical protein
VCLPTSLINSIESMNLSRVDSHIDSFTEITKKTSTKIHQRIFNYENLNKILSTGPGCSSVQKFIREYLIMKT